jgi:hypothetical protein
LSDITQATSGEHGCGEGYASEATTGRAPLEPASTELTAPDLSDPVLPEPLAPTSALLERSSSEPVLFEQSVTVQASPEPLVPPLAPPERVRIDKSVLALNEPTRIRDAAHLKFVASQPCLICGRNRAQAHHLRFAQPKAMGRKVSDEYTVPLCSLHHRLLHQTGNEIAWWEYQKIDPMAVAAELWRQSRAGVNRPIPSPIMAESDDQAVVTPRAAGGNGPP